MLSKERAVEVLNRVWAEKVGSNRMPVDVREYVQGMLDAGVARMVDEGCVEVDTKHDRVLWMSPDAYLDACERCSVAEVN